MFGIDSLIFYLIMQSLKAELMIGKLVMVIMSLIDVFG